METSHGATYEGFLTVIKRNKNNNIYCERYNIQIKTEPLKRQNERKNEKQQISHKMDNGYGIDFIPYHVGKYIGIGTGGW